MIWCSLVVFFLIMCIAIPKYGAGGAILRRNAPLGRNGDQRDNGNVTRHPNNNNINNNNNNADHHRDDKDQPLQV
jgi:hypothetical protein